MRGRTALQKHYRAKFRQGGWTVFAERLGAGGSWRRSFLHSIQLIPSNWRCHGTSNAVARAGSAAIASSALRDATNDDSNPSCPADLSRRSGIDWPTDAFWALGGGREDG